MFVKNAGFSDFLFANAGPGMLYRGSLLIGFQQGDLRSESSRAIRHRRVIWNQRWSSAVFGSHGAPPANFACPGRAGVVHPRHEQRPQETPLAVDRGPADRAAGAVRRIVRAGMLDHQSQRPRKEPAPRRLLAASKVDVLETGA